MVCATAGPVATGAVFNIGFSGCWTVGGGFFFVAGGLVSLEDGVEVTLEALKVANCVVVSVTTTFLGGDLSLPEVASA